MNTIYSCKGCTEREIGCHQTCKKYIEEKAEHDRQMKEYNKSKPRVIGYRDYDICSQTAIGGRRRKRRNKMR